MGHWSILSSLDQMEGRTAVVPMPFREAISTVGYVLQEPGRVLVEWSPEGGYVARTIKHTPGWAFLIPVLLPFVRRTKTARLEFTEVDGGTAVTISGAVDTKAAMRLRALAAVAPVSA